MSCMLHEFHMRVAFNYMYTVLYLMYIHMHVCMYVHMHVCMYGCIYVCMYICVYVYMCV